MLSVVALNPKHDIINKAINVVYINFGDVQIPFGLVEFEQPAFDLNDPKNDDYLLIKVNLFSCNYRDKAILVNNFEQLLRLGKPFLPFGSEFSATIVAKGRNVDEFCIGDKVIPNCTYEGVANDNVVPGVTTNFASLGWLRIRREKLIKQPHDLSDSEAACFSLGAQTAYSMIRKSGILEKQNKKAVVFSSRSVTSLFIIQLLNHFGIDLVCCSSSGWSKDELDSIGIKKVVSVDGIEEYFDSFTHVFDPYFDLNFSRAVSFLNNGGKYVFCGFLNQHPVLSKENDKTLNTEEIFNSLKLVIVKNLSLIGNCLGSQEDLNKVIEIYGSKISPTIDSEYNLGQLEEFLTRSFFDKNKLGKCVIDYSKEGVTYV
ncbi:quinone oxidoreductase family protein [Streptococcus equi]|uniref:Putative alcohol dehydrogenase n=1 Tax=Streptococcus equi subsp. zooepidemicus TaxID=40041 RepID=A0A7Z8ZUE9_STRSZ|nr:zinc-binding alcohol dehydrogenase family protein [Streptococcus equi]VEF05465.1 putative alcohol dehydrogenase [Streptococcus equi subsp. zooepidemicus]